MIAVNAGQHLAWRTADVVLQNRRAHVRRKVARLFRFRHAPMTRAAALSEPGAADLGSDQHDAAVWSGGGFRLWRGCLREQSQAKQPWLKLLRRSWHALA